MPHNTNKHTITICHVIFSLVKSGKFRGVKHNSAADSEYRITILHSIFGPASLDVRDLTFSVGNCADCPLISLPTGQNFPTRWLS
jgi:hypothetical protein